MASENYFEQLVAGQAETNNQARQAQHFRMVQAAQQVEQQRRAAEQVSRIQGERDALYVGTDPSVVWGDEAARLCRQFLMFAYGRQETKGRAGVLLPEPVPQLSQPDSRLMRILRLGQIPAVSAFQGAMFGYPVATNYPRHVIEYVAVKRVAKNIGDGAPEPPEYPLPLPDVFLCEDGLLRRGRGALYVAQPDGSVWTPQVGQFTWARGKTWPARSYSQYIPSGTGCQDIMPQQVRVPSQVEWDLTFVPADIKNVLGSLALKIGG